MSLRLRTAAPSVSLGDLGKLTLRLTHRPWSREQVSPRAVSCVVPRTSSTDTLTSRVIAERNHGRLTDWPWIIPPVSGHGGLVPLPCFGERCHMAPPPRFPPPTQPYSTPRDNHFVPRAGATLLRFCILVICYLENPRCLRISGILIKEPLLCTCDCCLVTSIRHRPMASGIVGTGRGPVRGHP